MQLDCTAKSKGKLKNNLLLDIFLEKSRGSVGSFWDMMAYSMQQSELRNSEEVLCLKVA